MYGVNQSSVDEAIYCKARKLEFVLCMIFCFKNNSFSHNFSKVLSSFSFCTREKDRYMYFCLSELN